MTGDDSRGRNRNQPLELIRLQSKSDAPKPLAFLDAKLQIMQAGPQVDRQNGETDRASRRERAHLSRLRVELKKHLPGL